MAKPRVLETILIVGAVSVSSWTQAAASRADENEQLKARVDSLERQVEQLTAAAGAPQPASTDLATKKSLWSSLDVQFYGYIKADAMWDSSRVTTGNYVIFVDAGGENDHEFNLTARQTRFGVRIKGPQMDGVQTSGLIEGDFYGVGGAENKSLFRMRHAYLQLDWPQQFSILAGQTWDVISPLYPETLNLTVLWDGGNIGHRHPQIRVSKTLDLDEETNLQLAGAVSRTIGDTDEMAGAPLAGEDAGFPTLQGRVGLTFPWFGIKPTALGLSGHWGQEDYAGFGTFDSWSLNLDVMQPVNKCLTVKAEAYVGENLDNYFGGIGQGVRLTRNAAGTVTGVFNSIGDQGGWVAAALTPGQAWRFNVGFGIDDVDNADVAAGARTQNRSIFANAIYAINTNADVGFEISHWRTNYRAAAAVDDLRLQASFIYKF